MTVQDLIIAFAVSQSQLELFLKDVSADQALRIPENGCNPINWILGHILSERVEALGRINPDHIKDIPELSMYITGSKVDVEKFLPFDQLLSLIPTTFSRINQSLETLDEATLSTILPGTMLGKTRDFSQDLLTYTLHEMYHIGQISVLRIEQ